MSEVGTEWVPMQLDYSDSGEKVVYEWNYPVIIGTVVVFVVLLLLLCRKKK